MKILFTFPGQGTQHPGMLRNLPDGEALLSSVRAVLGEETDALDSPEALRHTRAVQLCLLIVGVAWARELIRNGVKPDIVSGLSIGAYPAAVVAGALDFSDALRLVALRGDLMERAYPHGYGLTAIVGLTLSQLEKLMAGSNTYIANINAETQTVIAGRDEDMAAVAQKALDAGASKAARLAVSVPSHCALLDKPAAELASAFGSVSLSRPSCAYLSGSTGRVIWEPARIADDLAFNMARTVQWSDAVIAANQRDARLAIEMPPGNVLTALTHQAGWQGEAICMERNSVEVALHLAKRLSQ
ncbi:MAG: malonate decarboxylase subunit epsilon [Pantoea sp.]|uniref:malonate decarboxylase subunit epsilon n=1 Tax=Pantoea septica TaxID=472695 RepID=UPI001C122DDD|nr:malonate decarboxylase subunit epsilon [Pantoea septica]MBU5378633.1 malonate decarboxylase subunit epsilon [Pantoea septica]MDU5835907.1 malonate decarboxylase subunit epsilon [Pantoea sp.]MDU6438506.1 malonate decarboxylase subunit epsilon [Pantoea sp.]